MTKINAAIWGRPFEIDVVFDCYKGEDVLSVQEDALDAIQEKWQVVDAALEPLKKYCVQHDGDQIGSDTIDNIFKYVKPVSLYVMRASKKRVVALMCDYRFDPEHGIALEFENETLRKIAPQDDVL